MQININGDHSCASAISTYLKSQGYSKYEFSWIVNRLNNLITFDVQNDNIAAILNNIVMFNFRETTLAEIVAQQSITNSLNCAVVPRQHFFPSYIKTITIIVFNDSALASFIRLKFSEELLNDY